MPERTASRSPARPPVSAPEQHALMAEFVAAGELERRRVAESIHDDSIQVIAAMGMRLQMLKRAISDRDQLAMLTEAEAAVQLSIARLRHIVFELHPPGLEQEGLSVAIAIALDVTERDSPADYRLDDQLSAQPGPTAAVILFRVAQEALANVREHAGADNVTVTLLERDGGHAIRITDDGCGCDPEAAAPGSTGYGFASMRARARLGGGTLHVESSAGAGTVVEVWLPGTDTGTNGAPA
jgi:signal transduction histidine kinase